MSSPFESEIELENNEFSKVAEEIAPPKRLSKFWTNKIGLKESTWESKDFRISKHLNSVNSSRNIDKINLFSSNLDHSNDGSSILSNR